jgi:hypothetical protein
MERPSFARGLFVGPALMASLIVMYQAHPALGWGAVSLLLIYALVIRERPTRSYS